MADKLVVIGNGMAPGRALEKLIEEAPGAYDITIFNAEPRVNYDRIMLSPVLSGEKTFEQIILHGDGWYVKNAITLYKGHSIVTIDRTAKTVTSAHGAVANYDKLIVATGSNPVVIPVPGHDLPGVLTYRDLDDVHAMLVAAKTGGHAVVIGGGLLGLEAAAGLKEQGMDVTVLHLKPTLMERQLDPEAGRLLQQAVEARGIRVITDAVTREIIGRDSRLGPPHVREIRLADGTVLPADLIVMAVGIRPNTALADAAGLAVNRGIVVDAGMRTNDPNIFALGECAEAGGQVYGLVAPLYEMASVVARQLSGDANATFKPAATATKLKVTGIDLFSAGDFGDGNDRQDIVLRDPARNVYKRIVLHGDTLIGAVLFGDTTDGAWFFEMIKSRANIADLRETLIFGPTFAKGGSAEPARPAAKLPDGAESSRGIGVSRRKSARAFDSRSSTRPDRTDTGRASEAAAAMASSPGSGP